MVEAPRQWGRLQTDMALCSGHSPAYSSVMAGYETSPGKQRIFQFVLIAAGVAVAGLVCAGIVGVVSGFVLRDEASGVGWVAGAVGGSLLGYPLGAVGGLLMLRRVLHIQGSLALGVIGAVVAAVLWTFIAAQLDGAIEASLVYTIYFLIVPILSAAGFLARRAGRTGSTTDRDAVVP